MSSILYNLLSVLLLSIWPFYIHEPSETEESLVLNEVDLSNHPQIYDIMKRIVNEGRRINTDKVSFMTVDLENDSCGIRMRIVAQVHKRLFWHDGYSGYTIIDDMPIIFENNSRIKLDEIPDSKGVFPMEQRFSPPFVYDPDIWLFLLKSNGYARYYHDRGWIWYEQEQPSNKVHLSSE